MMITAPSCMEFPALQSAQTFVSNAHHRNHKTIASSRLPKQPHATSLRPETGLRIGDRGSIEGASMEIMSSQAIRLHLP